MTHNAEVANDLIEKIYRTLKLVYPEAYKSIEHDFTTLAFALGVLAGRASVADDAIALMRVMVTELNPEQVADTYEKITKFVEQHG